MRRLPVMIAIILFSFCATAQTRITAIKKVADGLYLMYYDTTSEKHIITKSTIVEFNNFIALLEMPISNDGAGATNLTDHTEGGEQVLQALKEYFPHKPLKYVLSTHWHPHSLSSVIPFISRGITVITTRENFVRLNEFIDSVTYKKYHGYIHFVGDAGMTIRDRKNSIIIYKLNKTEYPHIPTQDFLFFYLPKYNYLHNSCMFQRFANYKVRGKEMVSTRVEDLYKFISIHHLTPEALITTDTYWDGVNQMVSGDTLQAMMNNGITMSSLSNELINIDNETLVTKSDSILKYLMDNMIPYSIINDAVYTMLKQNNLKKALALARIQALINPSNPNVWDTYGEAYYFLGEEKLAKKYELQSRRIDKDFKSGGEKVWQADMESFKKSWISK